MVYRMAESLRWGWKTLCWLVALGLVAPAAWSQGSLKRAEMPPPKPQKGEYAWAEPADWKPPTLEELKSSWTWEEGPVLEPLQVAADYYKERYGQPKLGVAEALALKNDGKEANDKILSALSRPPSGPEEVDYDASINRYLGGAPTTLNPILYSSLYEIESIYLFQSGPLTFGPKMEPYADAGLTKKWLRNPLADMVVLRDDVTWEDGTPFTAYDIEFSYHVILDQRINVPAQRSGTEDLKWVKAYDAQTIVFFHKEPLATNVWNTQFTLIPKHVYSPGLAEDPTMRASDWNVYWNLRPLSNGPYKLVEHQTGQHLLFERREDWYQDKAGKPLRPKPYIKSVRMRIIPDPTAVLLAFKKGELDDGLLLARQWAMETDDADFRRQGVKASGTEWTYNWIGWNQRPVPDAPFFKDKRVREAMTLALNHEELLQEIYFGIYDASACPFHPDSWMHDPSIQPFEQDLDKAEELLDEAGWTDSDGDGVRDKTVDGKTWKFEFTMNVPIGGTGDKVATLLKEDLDSIGVRMNIKMIEWATYQQITHEHKFEANVQAWGTGTDPDTAKNIFQTKMYNDGRNYTGYSNPRVDELFELGMRELDFEKRKAIYQEIDRLIHADIPYTFTSFRRTLWAFSKRLRGYHFSPRQVYSYVPGFFSIWVPKNPGA